MPAQAASRSRAPSCSTRISRTTAEPRPATARRDRAAPHPSPASRRVERALARARAIRFEGQPTVEAGHREQPLDGPGWTDEHHADSFAGQLLVGAQQRPQRGGVDEGDIGEVEDEMSAGSRGGKGERCAKFGRAGQIELAGDRQDVDPLMRVVIEPEAHRAIVNREARYAIPGPLGPGAPRRDSLRVARFPVALGGTRCPTSAQIRSRAAAMPPSFSMSSSLTACRRPSYVKRKPRVRSRSLST